MLRTARDALTCVLKVSAEARPPSAEGRGETLYAVFAAEDPNRFLGLVSVKEIAAHPARIFADLIARPPLQVAEDMPLDQVFRQLEQAGSDYAAVVDGCGHFLGALTRTSLLEAILAENRCLTAYLLAQQEHERRYLARELHDEVGQYLVALRAELESLALVGGAALQSQLQALGRTVEHLCGALRRVIRRLRPELLDQLGLADALQELLAEYRCHNPKIAFALKVSGDFKDLDGERALALYRVAQEALSNAVRHARASRVALCLCRFPNLQNPCRRYFPCPKPAVYLAIVDNGVGLAAPPKGGLGLMGMRERIEALGGTLKLIRPSKGVALAVELPLG
ncbi:hypothetical protein JCM13664_05790 [Methylothermus subterraneus]